MSPALSVPSEVFLLAVRPLHAPAIRPTSWTTRDQSQRSVQARRVQVRFIPRARQVAASPYVVRSRLGRAGLHHRRAVQHHKYTSVMAYPGARRGPAFHVKAKCDFRTVPILHRDVLGSLIWSSPKSYNCKGSKIPGTYTFLVLSRLWLGVCPCCMNVFAVCQSYLCIVGYTFLTCLLGRGDNILTELSRKARHWRY